MINGKVKQLSLVLGLPLTMLALSACSSSSDETPAPASAQAQSAESYEETGLSTESAQLASKADADALDNPLFMGRAIYLRGEMNDYSVQRPYRLRKFDDNIYCTIAPLRSDWSPYRFKFADAEWTKGTNFGYALPPAVIREGGGKAMLNPNSRFEELRYEPLQDGIYRFCIEYENEVPFATVTRLEDGKLTTMDEVIKQEIDREFSAGTRATTTAAAAADAKADATATAGAAEDAE